jgi:hypothetical protein
VIDVAAEVSEALLVVPEPFEERVGHAFTELTQHDCLFGDAFLESDHVAPCSRTRFPDRGCAFERAVLVEQCVPESWPTRNAPHRWLELPRDESEDRRLAGAVAPDDAPPLALGDGEGDVLEEFGRAEGDADVGKREKSHTETGIGPGDIGAEIKACRVRQDPIGLQCRMRARQSGPDASRETVRPDSVFQRRARLDARG